MLPKELIELIVEFLLDSSHTLRRCCLVSRTFAAISQPLLFRKVQLHAGTVSGSPANLTFVNSFRDAIESSPYLAAHIKTLALVGGGVYSDPALAAALAVPSLAIEYLILNGSSGRACTNHKRCWGNLDKANLRALKSYQLPSIRQLALVNFHSLDYEAFTVCTSLRRLTIFGVCSDANDPISPMPRAASKSFTLPLLEQVEFDNFDCEDFWNEAANTMSLSHFLRPSTCPNLRRMVWGIPMHIDRGWGPEMTTPDLRTFRPLLTYLDLGPWPGWEGDWLAVRSTLSLSDLRCLKTLAFNLCFPHHSSIQSIASLRAAFFIRWLTVQLRNAPKNHPLETVRIRTSSSRPQDQYPEFGLRVIPKQWSELDEVLDDRCIFPSFSGLYIDVFPSHSQEIDLSEAFETFLQRAFSINYAAGLVHCVPSA